MLSRFLLFTFLVGTANYVLAKSNDQPLILLSIDGFSNNYLDKYQPKNLLKLAKQGVIADALIPVFPSKTFPNHLSIITGLYPANHGIVHNTFYNTEIKDIYKLGAGKNTPSWLTALPLWTVAEQQKVKTAVFFWPESEAPIADSLPRYYVPYDKSVPNTKRVKQLLNWLTFPDKERPQLLIAYFSTVDTAGHHFGPNAEETKQAVHDIDSLIGDLVEGIEQQGTPANIVIVSDHGMIQMDNKAIEVSELFVKEKKLVVVNGQTQLYVYSENTSLLESKRNELNAKNNGRFTAYLKADFPKDWMMKGESKSIPDLIVNATPPYIFSEEGKSINQGFHGYDVKDSDQLNAMFIASGPSFKRHLRIGAFSAVHIYPMLMEILGLQQTNDIDGDLKILAPILVK